MILLILKKMLPFVLGTVGFIIEIFILAIIIIGILRFFGFKGAGKGLKDAAKDVAKDVKKKGGSAATGAYAKVKEKAPGIKEKIHQFFLDKGFSESTALMCTNILIIVIVIIII